MGISGLILISGSGVMGSKIYPFHTRESSRLKLHFTKTAIVNKPFQTAAVANIISPSLSKALVGSGEVVLRLESAYYSAWHTKVTFSLPCIECQLTREKHGFPSQTLKRAPIQGFSGGAAPF